MKKKIPSVKTDKLKSILAITYRWVFRLYLAVTLPLLFLFAWNPTCRHVVLNTASHYRAKISALQTIHIGDSITAGGGHWSTRLSWLPLNSYTIAESGYTTNQIRALAARAIQYKPKAICVLSGTNDVFDPRFDLEYTIKEYDSMLSEIKKSGIPCIVTLIPYQTSTAKKHEVESLNIRIVALAAQYKCAVIDLNPLIAPKGTLLAEYTTDGVHFSKSAYRLWAKELKKMLRKYN